MQHCALLCTRGKPRSVLTIHILWFILYFQRWLHVGTEVTVQDFISALTVVGPLVEDTLCELAAQGSDTPVIVMNVTITVLLAGDALEQGSQGRARIAEAFPTFSKHKRLAIIFEDNWGGG